MIDGNNLGANIAINGSNLIVSSLKININSSVEILNVDFKNGSASDGGAIQNEGILSISNNAFSNNLASGYGGAIDNTGTLSISNSTFVDSFSEVNGGAIFNGLLLTVKNTTFVRNDATGNGGGIFNSGGLTVINSTFSNNGASLGGGIYDEGALFELKNTILANSTSGGDCYNWWGDTIDANTNSLIEINGPPGHMCGTPVSNADPMLASLTNNGGSMQTMALKPGSPAIDAGDDATCEIIDQRGMARPQGTHCDIGAFENDQIGIYYARPAASGNGDCTTWTDACILQTALSIVTYGDEVWVATGRHIPGSTREDTFQLVSGVGVYGGFKGTESLRSERNPEANLAILSGDINGDDNGFLNNSENSYTVVTGSGVDGTAILDGVMISGGNSDGGGGG